MSATEAVAPSAAPSLSLSSLYHALRRSTTMECGPRELTAADFRSHFMLPNLPCMLSEQQAGTAAWCAAQEWRVHTAAAADDDSRDSPAAAGSSPAPDAEVPLFTAATIHERLLRAKRLICASLPPSSSPTAGEMPAVDLLPAPRSAPNFPALQAAFGDMEEPVLVARVFSDQPAQREEDEPQTAAYGCATRETTMREFLDEWSAQEQAVATAAVVGDGTRRPQRGELRYLKDWHFALTHPQYKAYSPPEHFQDDWLNHAAMHLPSSARGAAQQVLDDFRFCYAGPAGTWTPMHSDVYNSFSWSANIVGRKLWVFFAPEWRPLLTIHGQLMRDVLNIASADPSDLSLSLDLLASLAATRGASSGDGSAATLPACFVWVQEEGEAVFVPSGWLHQVHNLDAAISINHNWVNACNLRQMYAFLRREWEEALAAVQGFDFEAGAAVITGDAPSPAEATSSAPASASLDPTILGNAWLVMRSNVGMSWGGFDDFLRTHAQRFEWSNSQTSGPCSLPPDVVEFSLDMIRAVRTSMEQDGVTALIVARAATGRKHEAVSSDSEAASPTRDAEGSSESDSDSEGEFILRRRQGSKRRTRIIRDDDDEAEQEWAQQEEQGDEEETTAAQLQGSDQLPAADALLQCAFESLSLQPAAGVPPPTAAAVLERPDLGVLSSASLFDTARPPAGAAASHDELQEFAPEKALLALLRLIFQELHAPLQLPALSTPILSLVADYAAPHPPPPPSPLDGASLARGPWFVVLTHYANGDTFSEEYAAEGDLLDGVGEYVRGCRARVREVEVEDGEPQAELTEQLDQLERVLAHRREAPSSSCSCPTAASLDDLLQLALTVGDEMIASQLGYGWTHVHECNERSHH